MMNFNFYYNEETSRFVFESGEGVEVSYNVDAMVRDAFSVAGNIVGVTLMEYNGSLKTIFISKPSHNSHECQFSFVDNNKTHVRGLVSPSTAVEFFEALGDEADNYTTVISFCHQLRRLYLC